jgi:hypothetical protein
LLTENQWAKDFIVAKVEKAVSNVIKTHNLIAIATGKAQDGKYYDKEIKKRVAHLIDDLTWQRKHNDELILNLKKLIK